MTIEAELHALETGALKLCAFPHAEHVRLAYEMLARHSFADVLVRYSGGLKLLVAKAGKPEVYHETRTVAFLSLINERRVRGGLTTWSQFIAANADLLEKRCLERWYSVEELDSVIARQVFILPSPR